MSPVSAMIVKATIGPIPGIVWSLRKSGLLLSLFLTVASTSSRVLHKDTYSINVFLNVFIAKLSSATGNPMLTLAVS